MSSWASGQPHHRASPSHRSPLVPSSWVTAKAKKRSHPWPLGKLTSPGLADLLLASLFEEHHEHRNSSLGKQTRARFLETITLPFSKERGVGQGLLAYSLLLKVFSGPHSLPLVVCHCWRAVSGTLGPQSEFKEPLFVPLWSS